MPTSAPAAPSTIKQLPVEYDQLINNLLDNLEYNCAQAKSLCFVTDSLGAITSEAKVQMDAIAAANSTILTTFAGVSSNFAVYASDLLGIYRPYYSDLNTVGMIQVVGDVSFVDMNALDNTSSTDAQYRDCWNALIEAVGDSKRGF